MNILVAKNGSQLGPFTEADIRTKLASGELTPTDLGWKEGMAAWSPLSTMFASAPPQPAPLAPTPPQAYSPPGQSNPGAYTPQPQPQPQSYQPQGQPQSYSPQPYSPPQGQYNAPQGQYAPPQTYNSPYPSPYQQGGMQQWGAPGASMYGGFWMRFLAAFIDGIIIGIPLQILGYVAIQAFGSDAPLLVLPINILTFLLYYTLLESSAKQATLGKMALGLKVTDVGGNRLGFGRALGRSAGKYLSVLLLGIGYIMAAFTERKQALHDLMANALVVKK